MNAPFIRSLAKPEYFLRPGQLLRRLARGRFAAIPSSAIVELPWGLPIEVAPNETIGGGIWRQGVHELAVSEVLWRLIDPGDTVVDVGANIGYLTGLMAVRTGARGLVWAFEPHPDMRRRLLRNIDMWRGLIERERIKVFPIALSDVEGIANLCLPEGFQTNTGTAYLESAPVPSAGTATIHVETRRLEDLTAVPGRVPAVIKIDVEGHELQVLAGAGDLLSPRGARDIVFEEHRAYPAASVQLLQQRGYSLYKIRRSFLRPKLLSPDVPPEVRAWEAPNFLATRDPDRAHARLRRVGWACLSGTERAI